MTKIVKAYTKDAPTPPRRIVRDAGGAGPARRTEIASFHGTSFVAERDGDELKIYMVSGDAVSTQATGDNGPMTIARLQAIMERSRVEGAAK